MTEIADAREREILANRLRRHGLNVDGGREEPIHVSLAALEMLADRLDGIAEVVNKAAQELWTLQSLAEYGGAVQERCMAISSELADLNLLKEGE